MRLLLDTHALLWALAEPERIPAFTRRHVELDADEVLVSAVSGLEIAIKQSLSKLSLPAPASEWLPARVSDAGLSWLAISPDDAMAVGGLPWFHRDPFNRLLVAQAKRHGLVLVSADSALHAYGVKILWE